MPEIFRLFGLRFFYYANDHLPIHVHVENGDGEAKFNIVDEKILLVFSDGMKNKDLRLAEAIIEENRILIIKHWNKYFGNEKN